MAEIIELCMTMGVTVRMNQIKLRNPCMSFPTEDGVRLKPNYGLDYVLITHPKYLERQSIHQTQC